MDAHDIDITGRPWSPRVLKIMDSPGALRARAAIRRVIAEQDREWGDTWAEHNNLREAQRLEGKAYAKSVGGP